MFDIGFLELMVVAVLGLIILGPERLPKAARTAAMYWGKVRRTMTDFQDDIERQIRTEELKEKLKDPYATFIAEEDNAAKEAEQASTAESDLYASVIAEQDQKSTADKQQHTTDPVTSTDKD